MALPNKTQDMVRLMRVMLDAWRSWSRPSHLDDGTSCDRRATEELC